MNTSWNVTDSGYSFQKTDSVDKQKWEWLTGELEMLYSEGKALYLDSCYVIPHDTASSFSEGKRHLLGLPPVFPYDIYVTSNGRIGTSGFSFTITYRDKNNEPIINPVIIGSYIEIHKVGTGMSFMFNHAQYDLVREVMHFNKMVEEETDSKELVPLGLEIMAKVKSYIQAADATAEPYIKSTKIMAPDALSVKVESNGDGTYRVMPVLLKKNMSGEYEVNGDSFSRAYNRKFTAQRHYLGEDKVQYVFTKKQKEGLAKVKKLGKVNQETAEIIRKQPQSIFIEDVFNFDINLYSDRVQCIGDYIRKTNPFMLNGLHGHWLPDESVQLEDGEELSDTDELEITRDNVSEIHDSILEAINNQKDSFSYHGTKYLITEKLIDTVDAVFEHANKYANDGKNVPENPGDTIKSTKNILIIKDNTDALEYVNNQGKSKDSDQMTKLLFAGLRPEIRLFPHQIEGVRHLANCWLEGHHGALLADDMGLGKTLQAYSFISGMKKSLKHMESVLIVAPVSLLKNWEDEYQKFVKPDVFDGLCLLYGEHLSNYKKVERIANSEEPILTLDLAGLTENHIILTTYETLRMYQLTFGKMKWSVMIIDEAQKIKNPQSLVSMAVRGMNYDFGIALTGTPVENTWIDLWTIMDFVAPGKMHSQKEFTSHYVKSLQNIIKTGGNADAIEGLGMELRRDLDPLFIRRMKKDVAKSLPQKAVSKVKEIMPPVQKQAYESIIARARLAKRTKGKINPLQIINDLRTSSLFPNLDRMNEELFLNLSAEDFFMSSARLKRMLYILYAIKRRNEKVIIFVTLRLMQQKLRRELSKLFQIYIPVAINGTVEAESRQKIVDEFNSAQGFQILILSPEAAGVGLNITGANNVIHLSRSWNPAKEDQATDRVYRIGQKRDVNVYIPIAYDSALGEGECFDEKLDKLLDFKRSLSDVALFPSVETQKDQEYLLGCVFNHEDGPQSISSAESWDMDELDRVNEKTFKSISAKLLRNLGYDVSVANRRGVDLKADRSNGEVLLVRCAQCIYPDKLNIEDIIGIADAVKRKSDIGALVITNSTSIDQHIIDYARKMDVRIWNRQTLENLLRTHPILK